MLPLEFVGKVHNYEISLDDALEDQNKLEKLIIRLENNNPKKTKTKQNKTKQKNKLEQKIEF